MVGLESTRIRCSTGGTHWTFAQGGLGVGGAGGDGGGAGAGLWGSVGGVCGVGVGVCLRDGRDCAAWSRARNAEAYPPPVRRALWCLRVRDLFVVGVVVCSVGGVGIGLGSGEVWLRGCEGSVEADCGVCVFVWFIEGRRGTSGVRGIADGEGVGREGGAGMACW